MVTTLFTPPPISGFACLCLPQHPRHLVATFRLPGDSTRQSLALLPLFVLSRSLVQTWTTRFRCCNTTQFFDPLTSPGCSSRSALLMTSRPTLGCTIQLQFAIYASTAPRSHSTATPKCRANTAHSLLSVQCMHRRQWWPHPGGHPFTSTFHRTPPPAPTAFAAAADVQPFTPPPPASS